jgi:hypothetical protein
MYVSLKQNKNYFLHILYYQKICLFSKRKKTNLSNKGLISADRNNKVTLLLTIPRYKFKSSAKDLFSPILENYHINSSYFFLSEEAEKTKMFQGTKPILILLKLESNISSLPAWILT